MFLNHLSLMDFMKIKTEQDMKNFCEVVNASGEPFSIQITDNLNSGEVERWEKLRKKYDDFPEAELKQGISDIQFDKHNLIITEIPYIHPFAKIPEDKLELKGPMTGVLVNCVDSDREVLLFQLRGKDIELEYSFQNAAAGFGRFRKQLEITAKKELEEEAGIFYPKFLFNRGATGFLPFMCGGYPQPLASYTFSNDLSQFPKCNNLDEVLEFREKIIQGIQSGKIQKKEGYHFTLSLSNVESIIGQLQNQKKFYGPIYDSVTNFLRNYSINHA